MEEYSGFAALYPYEDGWTLSELMYFLKQGKKAFACKLEGVIQQIGDLDYIPPLRSPWNSGISAGKTGRLCWMRWSGKAGMRW